MSWCCLIGASPSGARALRSAGWDFAVLTPPADLDLDVFRVASLSVPVVLNEGGVRAGLAAATAALGPPELIVSFSEVGQQIAADLAAEFGLPGVDPHVVARIRDKVAMRVALEATPLSWPYVAGDAAEVRDQLGRRFDSGAWVVKPRDGFGSRRVTVIHDRKALDAWYRMESSGADGGWIAEALAGGPEFSVETVTVAGRHHILAVTAKTTSGAPHFVEVGHVVPAPLGALEKELLCRATTEALDALGLQVGAAHTEIRLDPCSGPVIIETHTRPGGDFIPELVLRTTGRDQYGMTLAALLGRELPAPDQIAAPAAAIYFLAAERDGSLAGISVSAAAVRTPGLVRAAVSASIGDLVSAPRQSNHRLGYVITQGDDPAAAFASATAAMRGWQFEIRA